MIPVTDLRAGATFQVEGVPFQVTRYEHVKMGRGNAVIRVTCRNLKTGAVEEKTFQSGAQVETAQTTKRHLQFLYQDDANAVFVDPQTYEQTEIRKEILGETLNFLKVGQPTDILFWSLGDARDKDEPLSVELPAKVALTVIEAAPGVRGNSATNIFKQAKLENGLEIRVPLFINSGDKIFVDTRTGEYLERVSS